MAQYLVVRNTLTENVAFDKDHKCHKVRKSSGKISYKITNDSNGLRLSITDISPTQALSANKEAADSLENSFDFDSILKALNVNSVAGSASKLLPLITGNVNAKHITAVLLDLGLVRIK